MCGRHNAEPRTTQRQRRRAVASVKPPPRPSAPTEISAWIVADFEGRGFRCERCGATEKHSTANGVSRMQSFLLRAQAFGIDHALCEAGQ